MAKVLFIVGSLRKGSFNRQMAKEVEKIIGDRAKVSYLEYSDLPYMNQDIEFPAPEKVQRVRDAVDYFATIRPASKLVLCRSYFI